MGREEITDQQLIEKLKEECRRVKIQRNDYEQQLIFAQRKIARLKAEIKILQEKLLNH